MNGESKSWSRTDEIRRHVKFENNTSGRARLWDTALKFLCPGLFITSPDHLDFLLLEQIASSLQHTRVNAAWIFADVARGKWRPKFPTFFILLVHNSTHLCLLEFCWSIAVVSCSNSSKVRNNFKVSILLPRRLRGLATEKSKQNSKFEFRLSCEQLLMFYQSPISLRV